MVSLSDRMFLLLKERGMEQKEFAALLGIKPQTVSTWRTRKTSSYTKYLARIAEVLHVSVEYLVNGDSTVKPSCQSLEEDEQVKELAAKIVQDILASGFTYQKANDALAEAQRILLEQTKPSQ